MDSCTVSLKPENPDSICGTVCGATRGRPMHVAEKLNAIKSKKLKSAGRYGSMVLLGYLNRCAMTVFIRAILQNISPS